MDKLNTFYTRKDILKKITKGYCEDNTIYYKRVIIYNRFDQPVILKEWTYNEDGSTFYQKQRLSHFTCFGELIIDYFDKN